MESLMLQFLWTMDVNLRGELVLLLLASEQPISGVDTGFGLTFLWDFLRGALGTYWILKS